MVILRLRAFIPRSVAAISLSVLLFLAVPRSSPEHAQELPSNPTAPVQADAGRARIVGAFGKLPLAFEANQGQTDASVKFLSRGDGYTLFLTGDEAVFALGGRPGSKVEDQSSKVDPQTVNSSSDTHHSSQRATNSVLQMKLMGANRNTKVSGIDQLPGKTNYFIGSDPAKWHTNVPSYGKVAYRGVYPGIDLVYYGNRSQLEYDFVVAPRADPASIRLLLDTRPHASRGQPLRVAANGDLVATIGGDEVRLRKPFIYQPAFLDEGRPTTERRLIDGRYRLVNNEVTFEIPSYDTSRPLVIDPVLVYSTYLAGSQLDKVLAMTVTAAGNALVVGGTTSTIPTTSGAFQTTYGGGTYDAFVTEFSPDGTSLVFSSYLGGNNDDEGWGVGLDSSQNVYVSGFTASPNFPTTKNAYQIAFVGSGDDAFLTKLNPTGSSLLYSTYIAPIDPGPALDHNDIFMTTSASGKAMLVGPTSYTSFPVTTGAFQTTLGGQDDAFLTIIDTTKAGTASLNYSTYLGGKANDAAHGVALDSAGNVYVVGTTHSPNFPVTTGAYQTTCKPNSQNQCSGDVFLAKFSPHGKGTADLLYSTFFGGSSTDSGVAIALDSSRHAYISGDTQSDDLPTTVGAFQTACDIGKSGTCEDSYIAKFNPAGAGASDLIYSTYFGGTGTTLSKAIGVDAADNAYVDGRTTSTDFPTMSPIQAAHAVDGGNYDGFVTELNAAGSALIFSTYLGGNNFDSLNALALDSSADIFIGGRTQSTNYPATPGAFQTQHTPNDALFNGIIGEISPESGVGLALGPASLTFGAQLVGTTSHAQSMTVLASGSASLSISSAVASPSPPFKVSNGCGSTVSPGNTCGLNVTFSPTSSGVVTGTLTLTDNAPGSPQTLNLTGTGTVVQLSPASLNFGDEAVGTTSAGQTITLRNKSTTTTLSVSGVFITGTESGDFSIETNTCGSSVSPGGNCSITVTFTPTTTGTRSASVSVSDNGGGSPQMVTLSGTGT